MTPCAGSLFDRVRRRYPATTKLTLSEFDRSTERKDQPSKCS